MSNTVKVSEVSSHGAQNASLTEACRPGWVLIKQTACTVKRVEFGCLPKCSLQSLIPTTHHSTNIFLLYLTIQSKKLNLHPTNSSLRLLSPIVFPLFSPPIARVACSMALLSGKVKFYSPPITRVARSSGHLGQNIL